MASPSPAKRRSKEKTMIKQIFTQPKVLSRLEKGVFGPYLPAFAAYLHKEGFSRECIRRHLRAADHFGAWLTEQRLIVGDLTTAIVERYIEGRGRLYPACRPNGRLPHDTRGLHGLVEFLKQQGVLAPTVETPLTSVEKWLAKFDAHLDRTLGCAPRTRGNYLPYARRFLIECFGEGEIEWQKLSAEAIVKFVQREAAKLQLASSGQVVTALRAFLRFLGSAEVGVRLSLEPKRTLSTDFHARL
jgi:hypothetical protein